MDEKLKQYWEKMASCEAFHVADSTFSNFQLRIHSDTPSFMGAPIARSMEDLKGVDAAFVGIPWEGIVGEGTGLWVTTSPKDTYPDAVESRRGAYDAPAYIRKYAYQYALHQSGGFYPEVSPSFRLADYIEIADYGDVEIKEWDAEETAQRAVEKVGEVVKAGAVPLVLGGDHSIPFPVLKAISDNTEGRTGIVWFDRHYDIGYGGPLPRAYRELGRLNAENALHRILDECHVEPINVVIVGIGGGDYNTPLMHELAKGLGITIFTVSDIEKTNIVDIMEQAIQIAGKETSRTYVTLDVDVMDPVSFPAQKWPEPLGLSMRDVCKAMAILVEKTELAGFVMCCFGPAYDTHGVGGLCAARLYIEILKGLAMRKMKGVHGG